MSLPLIITDGGRAAIIAADAAGTAAVHVVSVGVTATAFTATNATSSLPGEIKRLTELGGNVTAQDTIHVTARDDGDDAYTVRGFGLYLDDGTLLAAYGQASTILQKTALTNLILDLNIRLTDAVAGTISFGATSFTDPVATASVRGIVRFATPAEAIAGTATDRVISPATLDDAIDANIAGRRGAANGLASLDGAGKIPATQLPALAITETSVVASQAAMLALDAQVGDIAIRTDVSRSYILRVAGADTLGNWSELRTPTDTVLSVNGQTGAVSLVPADIGAPPTSRVISAGGLATGGGSLAADRTITVPKASAAELLAATEAGKAVTPAEFGALAHLHDQTGYQVMPGGLIWQWGRFSAASNSTTTVTFPLEFPNACYAVTVSGSFNGGDDSKDNGPGVVASSIDGNSFDVYSADDSPVTCCFWAIGK